MLEIDFEAGGTMRGGSYIKWQPCPYPRDAKGKWVSRKNPVGPQISDANRCRIEIISPKATMAVGHRSVDANGDEDDLGLCIVWVMFTLDERKARKLLLALAERHGVKRYPQKKMPMMTVILEGPESNLMGLIEEYTRLYVELAVSLGDTERKFFDRRFGPGLKHWL